MAISRRRIEVITGGRIINYPDLEINFTIKFDSEEEPNTSEIIIYNLSEDTRNSIVRGEAIIVNAGYNDDIGNVFTGVIYDVITTKDTVDRKMTITCIDVTPQYFNTQISVSYRRGTTASFIIRDILRGIGIVPNILDITEHTFNNGFSYRGGITNALKKLSSVTNSRLVIRNGNILFLRNDGIQTAEVIQSSTGLLDIEKIDKNNVLAQWRLRTTLKHSISTRSIVEVRSVPFNGLAIVQQGQQTKNFETIMEVVPL